MNVRHLRLLLVTRSLYPVSFQEGSQNSPVLSILTKFFFFTGKTER